MIVMTLAEIAEAVSGTVEQAVAGLPVTGISTDTRRLRSGDLFVALDGPRFTGSDYLGEAFRAGAVAAIAPREADVAGPLVRVSDSGRALLDVAAAVRRRLSVPVVAITGSNGKTTTKNALAALLAPRFRVVAAEASFNNAVGVPLTLCRAEPDTEALVLEVGTSAPGEIERLARVAGPTHAVITSIAPGHLEGLGGLPGVLKEKLSIIAGLAPGGRLYLNGDDRALREAAPAVGGVACRLYGRAPGCDLAPIDPVADARGVAFRMRPEGPEIRACLLGEHNLINLFAAACVARDLGVSEDELAAGAAAVRPPRLRLERRDVRGLEITFDCYNANPASMRAALETWAPLARGARRIVVLGDMLELGQETVRYHEDLGRTLPGFRFDAVVFVGPAMHAARRAAVGAGLAEESARSAADAGEARGILAGLVRPGDRVLLKGSRGMRLEEAIEGEGTD